MKSSSENSLMKKINIAHIYFALYFLNLAISIFHSILYRTEHSVTGLIYSVLTGIFPVILFCVGYYFLKKSDRRTRAFDATAILLAALSLSTIIFWLKVIMVNLGIVPNTELNLSLIIEAISVVIAGVILLRAKNSKTLLGFYKYFIILQLLALVIQTCAIAYTSSRMNLFNDNSSYLTIFGWLFVYVLAISISNIFLKTKSKVVRLYDSIVIATITGFAYGVFTGILAYPFATPVRLIMTLVVFVLSVMVAQRKESIT